MTTMPRSSNDLEPDQGRPEAVEGAREVLEEVLDAGTTMRALMEVLALLGPITTQVRTTREAGTPTRPKVDLDGVKRLQPKMMITPVIHGVPRAAVVMHGTIAPLPPATMLHGANSRDPQGLMVDGVRQLSLKPVIPIGPRAVALLGALLHNQPSQTHGMPLRAHPIVTGELLCNRKMHGPTRPSPLQVPQTAGEALLQLHRPKLRANGTSQWKT
ncbi:hypothetical protein BCR43DRAFT_272803 [Syncephalastrum racemosum]|uniref:Uncharacterized protein n=1 Tax=Syncephalastrum racemosum TaxID=13706 RepID=A0A1X2HC17_SYNRA|nr:hypothetical protein BCR43DRAFT_272803 [Syncephalastrum racemosum]